MNELAFEGLEPGMTLDQVGQIVGGAAIFMVTGKAVKEGGGHYGSDFQSGHGCVEGKTLTQPPLRWVINAEFGLERFKIDDLVTVNDLGQPGMKKQSFELFQAGT